MPRSRWPLEKWLTHASEGTPSTHEDLEVFVLGDAGAARRIHDQALDRGQRSE